MNIRNQVGDLLRARRDQIVNRWKVLLAVDGVGRGLLESSLVDRLPDFLEGIARAIAVETEEGDAALKTDAQAHAVQRLELGYDTGELTREYVHLRTALYDELHDAWPDMPAEAWRPVDRAIDSAVNDVVSRLHQGRDKKLRALERISKETIASPDMKALVDHLVDAFSKVAPGVDAAVIFTREGNALRRRAARGMDDIASLDVSVGIGEGFTGEVGSRPEPVFFRDAEADPRIAADLRSPGVHALYSVPLVHEGAVVGVAHVGSTTAYDFPKEDLLLISAFAERAAALIASRQRADKLEETERLRDMFLGMLGHDLRSPLNAIAGCAQLLLRRDIEEPAERRLLLRILGSVDRMDRLVSDILDFARTRLGGGIPVVFSMVNLIEICLTVVSELDLAHPGRVRFVSTLEDKVECDPHRMSQVISNLLVNAVEHGPASTVAEATLLAADGDAVLTVRNEGAPIAPELLPHLFDPFRPSHRRRVGLGLYITREIVVAHRGSIEVRSTHAGTTITVRVPRRQGPRAVAAQPEVAPRGDGRP